METSLETVTSTDGTEIAYERSGSGPPLVLVHGSGTDRSTWTAVRPHLADSFTVCAVDRRGRGDSGDGDDHSLALEAADVAAVVEAVDEPAFLLGHSFGALCSLEATRHTDAVRELLLYEPPIPLGDETEFGDVIGRIEAALDAGERDAALRTFFEDVVGASPGWVEAIQGGPAWEAGLGAIDAVPQEAHATNGFDFDPDQYADVDAPIRLLGGTETGDHLRRSTQAVADALTDGRIVTLEGEGHAAMLTAPEAFARLVTDLLLDDD